MPQATPEKNANGTPRTQSERTAAAEAAMISAAIDLLNREGLQGATLVAIGERAGYSRGLAGHHFGSKAGLFRAVLKKITADWTEDLTRALENKTGLAAVSAAVDAHKSHALSHPDLIRVQNILWGAALDPSSGFKPNVSEFMRIQRQSVAEWIRGGQALGEIRDDIAPELLGAQFYGCLIGITNQWVVNPELDLATAYDDFKSNMNLLLSAETP